MTDRQLGGVMYGCYSVVCAWCKKLLEINGTEEPHMDGAVSHAICETCSKELLKD